MRRLIPLLCLLLLATVVNACHDAAALTLERMTVTVAGDSLHVRVPATLPAGADSAVITLTLTPGGPKTATLKAPGTALTFAYVKPAEGSSFTFKACGIAYHLGVAGPSSCNSSQSYTVPITAPGAITWPDSMTISQMIWPDSASVALMRAAFADALPAGPLAVISGPDTIATGEWARWDDALLIRPGPGCTAACLDMWVRDTAPHSLAERNWQEVYWQARTFAANPTHHVWWDSVKACGGCAVYFPIDPTAPGAKT